jgi:hypothetical protein
MNDMRKLMEAVDQESTEEQLGRIYGLEPKVVAHLIAARTKGVTPERYLYSLAKKNVSYEVFSGCYKLLASNTVGY